MIQGSNKPRQLHFLNSEEVARMLGVNVSTIKRWTLAGKLPSQTTGGGHRRFLMADLAAFVEENRSESKKANIFILKDETDVQLSFHIVKHDFEFLKDFIFEQALESRCEKVQQVLNGLYMMQIPLHQIYDELLTPVLYELGERWAAKKISVVEEHIASQTIRDSIIRLQGIIRIPDKKVGRALLLTPSTELHDIALKMIDHLSEEVGFETYFSGQMTPLIKIEQVFEGFRPDRLYISSTYIEDLDFTQREIDQLLSIANNFKTQVFVGGN